MRPRTVLIVLALLCSVLVVGVVLFGLQAPPPQQQQPAHPHNVIVASVAIPVGTLIKPQDLAFAVPRDDTVPAATFDRVWADKPEEQAAADNKTIGEVVGAVARHRIEAGEPVNRGAVVKPGDSGFLAAVLRPGMRAITVAVTPVTGTGGLIYPGDHVDMILTQSFPASNDNITKKSVGETVADDLRVLAIDQQLQIRTPPDAGGAPAGKIATTVTLEVDPVQAQKIAVAERLGELSLTIRSLESADHTQTALAGDQGATTPSATGQAATAPTGAAAGPAVASASAAPIWAEDVSPALKITQKEAKKDEKPAATKPPIMVIRGDKADEVGVH